MNIPALVKNANGFSSFNPLQEKALKTPLFDQSTVVASPTASGKTVLAELCALDSILQKRQKVVYTCPLRALASEHYSDFKRKYANLKIRFSLSTGDLDSSAKYLENYDFVFCTNEKLDSLIRHRAEWLQSVGLLIVDEVHLLGSDRGPTLEIVIAKMKLVNPNLRILALSATIPNAEQIAEWLKAKLVKSDYRPVKLEEGVFFDSEIRFEERMEAIDSRHKDALSQVVEDTLHQKEKQCLVFLNSRKTSQSTANKLSRLTSQKLSAKEQAVLLRVSERIANTLEQPTSQCLELAELVKKGAAFHNAGLLQKQRHLVEEAFKRNYLKVICATPSLAAGVNLPAFRVIIPSLYRYDGGSSQRIPVSEYKQMCLPYGAQVFTKEFGEMGIGKIVEEKIKCRVLCWNEKNQRVEFRRITGFFVRQGKRLVELKTVFGNKIWLTPEHPILVRTDTGIRWKSAGGVGENEELLFVKDVPFDRQKPPFFMDFLPNDSDVYAQNLGNLIIKAKKRLSLTERALSKKLQISHKNIYGLKKNRKAMPVRVAFKLFDFLHYSKEKRVALLHSLKSAYGTTTEFPARISSDFLWLAGLVATDGNMQLATDKRTKSRYAKLRVFNKNVKIIQKAIKVLKKFGLVPTVSRREDGLITAEVGATLLCKILSSHFGIPFGNKTTTVNVPSFLLNSSRELIGAYLGGIFDGDGNYNEASKRDRGIVRRILFVTSSKKFAVGIQKLLLRIGVLATRFEKRKNSFVFLKNKKVNFPKPTFYVVFRKIEYLRKFKKYAKITKAKIVVDYSNYHNIDCFHDCRELGAVFAPIKKKRLVDKKRKVYNLAIEKNENYFANGILVHNCGRAGRPKYDSAGEAILLSNSEIEADELMEFFVKGELEEIESKLSIEPILRTHLLAAIATDFIFDLQSLEDFFSKTFYAFQFKQTDALFVTLSRILQELQELGFVESNEKRFKATSLGKRVAELYLDPIAAHELIQTLKQRRSFLPLTYLFSFVQTGQLFPLVSIPKKKEPEVLEALMESAPELPLEVEREIFSDDDLPRKFFTARMLEEWINEKPDSLLSDEFNMAPGLLRSKLLVCDWLSYAAFELCQLLGLENHLEKLGKLRKRLQHGVREELLNLVEVRGIGRVRARRLWNSNVRSVLELKKTDVKDLARILNSEKVSVQIKQNLGQLEKKPKSPPEVHASLQKFE